MILLWNIKLTVWVKQIHSHVQQIWVKQRIVSFEFCTIDENVIRCTLGFACFVTIDSISSSSLSSSTEKISGMILTRLFWTVSSQQLYNCAIICFPTSAVICLKTDQSVRNFRNGGFVISLLTTGILADGVLMVAAMASGHFPDWKFPDGQLPLDISPTDNSPDGHFPDLEFPERTFPRTDNSTNGHFP